MSAKDVVFKRRPVAVEIGGDTVHVRALTMKEALHVDGMKSGENEASPVRYAVSRCLLDNDGKPVFAEDSEEVDQIPMDTLAELFAAMQQATSPAKAKVSAKN